MSDIVERLYGIAVPITYEAADKITRLRDEINTCRELREYDRIEIERLRQDYAEVSELLNTIGAGEVADEIDQVAADNTRLRAEIEVLRRLQKRRVELDKEIERLRADNIVEVDLRREVQADHKRLQVALNNLYPEIERLKADNEHLRTALQEQRMEIERVTALWKEARRESKP